MPLPNESGAGRKHCRACYGDMPIEANKCVACGSVQNLERFVGLSGTILGLLVALVSVLTFSIPIWKAQFHTPNPKPSIALIETPSDDNISATFWNGGDAPMSVSEITFWIDSNPSIGLPLSPTDSAFTIVKPNDISAASLEIPSGALFPIVQRASELFRWNQGVSESNFTCRLAFEVTDPSGTVKTLTLRPGKSYCRNAALVTVVNWCNRTEAKFCSRH